MIRVICSCCAAPVLLLAAPDDGEPVICPHCRRPFVPDEEEWVDPEDG